MNVLPNWTTHLWADHTLSMLDVRAEVFEHAAYHSKREWSSYVITDLAGNRIARGTAGSAGEAKGIAFEFVVLRWNARATR